MSFPGTYGRALNRHMRAPGEATLRQAYELGRSALELATAHHDALRHALHTLRADELDEHIDRAADFLAEALTAHEMVRRGFVELREAERQQRHHAAVVRGLSALLADTSLAVHGRESIAEMLQLVVEHARELTDASRCVAEVAASAWPGRLEAISEADAVASGSPLPDLTVPLTSLDGSPLGKIALWSSSSHALSELDEALVVHVAQMASAALDRASLFVRDRAR
jgi:hypothetical protein